MERLPALDLRRRHRQTADFEPAIEVFARPREATSESPSVCALPARTPQGLALPTLTLRAATDGRGALAGTTAAVPGRARAVFFRIPTAPVPRPEVRPAAVELARFEGGGDHQGFAAIVPAARRDRRGRARQIGVVAAVLALPGLSAPAEALAGDDPTAGGGAPATTQVERPAAAAPAAIAPGLVWDLLVDREVELAFVNGATQRVTVLRHDALTVTVEPGDGAPAIVYLKADIVEVRAAAQAARALPPPRGRQRTAAGAVFLGIGAPILVAGVVLVSTLTSFYLLHAPLLTVGTGLTIPGILLVAQGASRERKYRKWQAQQRPQAGRLYLTPAIARTRDGGWSGGLRLSF